MSAPQGRRRFIGRLGATVGGLGVVGTALATVSALLDGARLPEHEVGRDGLGILRPPGALAEREFLARCIRCDRCAEACAPGAIRLVPSGGGAHSGTPFIVPRVVGCTLCLECCEACPTGALVPLESTKHARMGVAVVDERLCVSHNGTGVCGACHTVCPLRNRAITQDHRNSPTVHEEACVGCGLCEEACIVHDRKAIRVSTDRAWRSS